MVTLDEIKQYIGIDFDDDDAMLLRLERAADAHIKAAVGEAYPTNDPQAEMLKLAIVHDLYQNRGTESDKLSNATRHMFADMQTHLRLKMRDAT